MSTLAIEVHHHEGPRQLILLRSLSKSVFKDVGIQIPTCVVAVEEDGFGTEVANRIAARYEGKRGAKDLVAGPDTEQSQAKVDRGSSGAESNPWQADAGFEFLLKCRDVWPYRREPVGLKGLPIIRNKELNQ